MHKNEEEAAAAADGMNDIGKTDEFMFCGIDLMDATPPPIMEEREAYKKVVISFKKTTTKKLVEVAKEMEIQYMGTKKVLWERIVKSGHPFIVLVANDGLSFKFCHKKAPEGGSVPTWVILTPEPVPPISGMDMRTGAQIGFFGQTNPTNSEGAVRSNFCMGVSDWITRPTFGPKKQPPPPGASSAKESIPNEKGHPSPEAYASIFHLKFVRPKDFFDLQISPSYIANI